MFTKGLEKTAGGKAPAKAAGGLMHELKGAASSVGQHIKKNRKDYLLGTAAVGSLGTAIGANRTANSSSRRR
jgi:hypothetical protein